MSCSIEYESNQTSRNLFRTLSSRGYGAHGPWVSSALGAAHTHNFQPGALPQAASVQETRRTPSPALLCTGTWRPPRGDALGTSMRHTWSSLARSACMSRPTMAEALPAKVKRTARRELCSRGSQPSDLDPATDPTHSFRYMTQGAHRTGLVLELSAIPGVRIKTCSQQ